MVLFPIPSEDMEVVKPVVCYFLAQSVLPSRRSLVSVLMKIQQGSL